MRVTRFERLCGMAALLHVSEFCEHTLMHMVVREFPCGRVYEQVHMQSCADAKPERLAVRINSTVSSRHLLLKTFY